MKGERLAWFRLALKLGQSVQRTRKETTSSEFVDWMVFFDIMVKEEDKRTKHEEYYLAQIAFEVYNSFAEKRKGKIEDFLIKFERKTPKQKKRSKRKVRSRKIQQSRSFWLGSAFSRQPTAKASLPEKVKIATEKSGIS